MVSAVFHSPRGTPLVKMPQVALRLASPEPGTSEATAATPATPGLPAGPAGPAASATRAPREPFDWRALAGHVLPPLVGFALIVAIWGLLTQKGGTFPTPAATFDAAVKLFADPFYRKGPNDQGIGWNVLYSLERVGLGFGLAPPWAYRWVS